MKKEYHYTISRTDRICLVCFVVLLLAWELIKGIFPGGEKTYTYIPEEKEYTHHDKSYNRYKKTEYSDKYPRYKKTFRQKENRYENFRETKQTPPSQPIPIMTASVKELMSTGLSKNVAFNVQKFIASGAILDGPEDLMKIYGMDSMQLQQATPHIIFAPKQEKKLKPFSEKEFALKPHAGMVDLNSASAIELISLDGIGTVLAERIIKFRESLGGFLSPEQLKDCYGISPEVYDQLKQQLIVSGSPQLIMINEADLSTLTHPYLNKKIIRLVKAYRDQHGPYENMDALKKVHPTDTSWCKKISPYLSFTQTQKENR